MLGDSELMDYLAGVTEDQGECISKLRALILETEPGLVETVDEGKWFRGMLVYHSAGGQFKYALGTRPKGDSTLHMMPFYGSKMLQERHGEALKKLLTGKSCIRFKRYDSLPIDAIRDIFEAGRNMSCGQPQKEN